MDFYEIWRSPKISPPKWLVKYGVVSKKLDLKGQTSHLHTDKNIPECERLKIGFEPITSAESLMTSAESLMTSAEYADDICGLSGICGICGI